MNWFKKTSVKSKLVRTSLISILCALSVFLMIGAADELIKFRDALSDSIAAQTRIIGGNITAALLAHDTGKAKETLSALNANPDIDHAVIYAKDGRVFARYAREGAADEFSAQQILEDFQKWRNNRLLILHRIIVKNEPAGALYIEANSNRFYKYLLWRMSLAVIAMSIAVLVSLALVERLQAVITEPILDLAQLMERVSGSKDYSLRAEIKTADEIGGLAAGFNNMLAEIQQHDHELEIYRANLEELVAKRTAALNTAYAQLVHTSRLSSVGQLAAGVAHEIKNPLAIIIQGMDFIKSSLRDSPLFLDAADRITNAALRADHTVKGLLSFARQTPPAFEYLDISAIIEEALSLVEHQFGLRNVKIIREFDADLRKIMVDGSQMKQVFLNLLTNAFEAMPKGGTIAIRTMMKAKDSNAQIVFEDTGPGIPAEDLQKVFDPFYTTKRKSGGTGLGLSITHGIIQMHNGSIHIESGAGKGTKVVITLPYH
jgi:two-component system NtrC family sensor kinase